MWHSDIKNDYPFLTKKKGKKKILELKLNIFLKSSEFDRVKFMKKRTIQ